MKKTRKFAALLVLVLAGLMISPMPTVYAAEAGGVSLDYSELERQIGIANGLDSYDYTAETWEVLQKAVETGNKRLAGNTEQSVLDGAAEDIELAVENLVKMDYSALIGVLDEIYAKIDENPEEHDVWYRLDKAVDKARPLLVSGDQAAVDEMAQSLNALVEELKMCEANASPDVIIQEVEVEVPPSQDYCNIPMHRMWMTLFIVSAVINVLLLAVLGYVLMKKKQAAEHTPMVNIDLDADLYGDMDGNIYDDMKDDMDADIYGTDADADQTEE